VKGTALYISAALSIFPPFHSTDPNHATKRTTKTTKLQLDEYLSV